MSTSGFRLIGDVMKKIKILFILVGQFFLLNINCFATQTYTDAAGKQQMYQDGADLLKACRDSVNLMDGNYKDVKDTSMELATQCSAGIDGFETGYKTNRNSICFPAGVTLEQNIRVIYTFINNHPEKLNLSWNQVMIEALSTAFLILPHTTRH